MIVKCRCRELVIISVTTETIEETGRPKKIGDKICTKCKRHIKVYALVGFDESRG